MNKLLFWAGQIGHDPNLPDFIQKKVRLSNQIATLMALLVGIPLSFITLIFMQGPAFFKTLPLIGCGFCSFVLVLNHLKLHYLSRFLLALIPTTLTLVYHSYVVSAGGEPLAGLFILQTGFALLALVLFDLPEWPWLLFIAFLNGAGFLSFDHTNSFYEIIEQSPVGHDTKGKVILVLGLCLAYAVIYFLLRLNKNSEHQLQQLQNDLSQQQLASKDSEAELKDYIEKTSKAQEQEKLRIWESEGIAKFGEILRVHDNSEDIYDKLISELVKYMGAIQGGFYLVKEEKGEKHLELISCYAFQRKKFLHKKIALGEGLVGQAYLEKLPVFLTEIPEEYVKITSGLGNAPPTNIIITPLIHNDVVEGVIELASFKALEQYKLEFLEKLGTNIAAWSSGDRVNQRTRQLYEESQLQGQKMKEQEEEMRQNLEELAATQEDMKRKEAELKKLLAKSNEQFIQQSLQEIKLQIHNDLEGAGRELKFLSNVPPISGIFRAIDHDMIDPKDNSSYDVWVNRLVTILEALLVHKAIYYGVHLYENSFGHIISVINDAGRMDVKKQQKQPGQHDEIIRHIKNYQPTEIFINEPNARERNRFIIKLGISIYWKGKQRGVLVLDLLGDAMVTKIQSKEDPENAFKLSNSLDHTFYEKPGGSDMKESAMSEHIVINEKQNFQLLISHMGLN